MSEQIREQVSAFLDGELPNSETELLLKRLTRDSELRDSFGRYALIGESIRGASGARLSHGFTAKVNRAIDGEPVSSPSPVPSSNRLGNWWRPFAGAGIAAGVAAIAVVALQHRAVPTLAALPAVQTVAGAKEPLSYTVPAPVAESSAALPAARLTNYVFAHSRYSSGMGQSNVLTGWLADSDEEAEEAAEAAARAVPTEAVATDAGATVRGKDGHGAP
jgi:sigma-E factor negative regulatory protein RseA